MRNIKELTENLMQQYGEIVAGSIPPDQAKNIANVAGKIIKSCALQLDYNQTMKYTKRIEFLEYEGVEPAATTPNP